MQNKSRKLLSTLLALTMVFGMFAGMPLTASAAAPYTDVEALNTDLAIGDVDMNVTQNSGNYFNANGTVELNGNELAISANVNNGEMGQNMVIQGPGTVKLSDRFTFWSGGTLTLNSMEYIVESDGYQDIPSLTLNSGTTLTAESGGRFHAYALTLNSGATLDLRNATTTSDIFSSFTINGGTLYVNSEPLGDMNNVELTDYLEADWGFDVIRDASVASGAVVRLIKGADVVGVLYNDGATNKYYANSNVVTISNGDAVNDIEALIQDLLVGANNSGENPGFDEYDNVIVTGSKTNVPATNLNITIPATKTVIWGATYKATTNFTLLSISGSGTFEVAAGGMINAIDGGISVTNNANNITIKITGGTVATTSGTGIGIDGTGATLNADIIISSGTVSATTGIAISSPFTVVLSGGTVSATTGTAIEADGIYVTGEATVSNNGGTNPAIKVTGGEWLWADDADADLTVNGNVEVNADYSGVWSTEGKLTINGSVALFGENDGLGADDGGQIIVTDAVSFITGDYPYIEAGDGGSAVTINGAVSFAGDESHIYAFDGGKIDITGNVSFADDDSEIGAYDDGEITIKGNVTFGGDRSGVWSEPDGTITITGIVTANFLHSGFVAVYCDSGGNVSIGSIITTGIAVGSLNNAMVTVNGNVKSTAGDRGVWCGKGGIVFINGTLFAANENIYIGFYDQPALNFIPTAKTPYPSKTTIGGVNYYTYTYDDRVNDPAFVYIKVPSTSSSGGGGGKTTYTVTFNSNGGSAVSSHSISSGGKVTKPADPAKAGFDFAGWYTDSALTTAYDFNNTVTSGFALYAKWTEKDKNLFKDVSSSTWYYDAVTYVFEKGLMNGTADNIFSPDATLTRAMIVTILYRHAGEPDVSGLPNPFNDVPEGQWYTDAVKWAAANGIVLGYGNGLFGVNDPVTKEQLASLIYRTQQADGKIPPDILTDKEWSDRNKINDYAKAPVNALTVQGVFRDIPGENFNPQNPATRAEVASILYRYLTAIGK